MTLGPAYVEDVFQILMEQSPGLPTREEMAEAIRRRVRQRVRYEESHYGESHRLRLPLFPMLECSVVEMDQPATGPGCLVFEFPSRDELRRTMVARWKWDQRIDEIVEWMLQQDGRYRYAGATP